MLFSGKVLCCLWSTQAGRLAPFISAARYHLSLQLGTIYLCSPAPFIPAARHHLFQQPGTIFLLLSRLFQGLNKLMKSVVCVCSAAEDRKRSSCLCNSGAKMVPGCNLIGSPVSLYFVACGGQCCVLKTKFGLAIREQQRLTLASRTEQNFHKCPFKCGPFWVISWTVLVTLLPASQSLKDSRFWCFKWQ